MHEHPASSRLSTQTVLHQKGDENFLLTGSKINKVKTPWVETVLPATLLSPAHTAAVQHHVGPVAEPWKGGRKKEAGAGFVLMVTLGSLPGLLCKGAPAAQQLEMRCMGASPSSCLSFPSKQLPG